VKIEFNGDGEWKDVDCKFGAVPAAIIPKKIASYVEKNYPDAKIIKIDRDRRDYEVSLSNRLELTFDMKFNLVEIDD
jgi:predicted nucleotide-binding protein (sugar kinase/HSP70/actin superfamily)